MNRGFTLIEVLLSTLIFVMAVGGIVAQRNFNIHRASENRFLTQAQALAEMKMTEMEIKFQTAINKDGVTSALGSLNGTFDTPYQDFSWTADLKEDPIVVTSAQMLTFLKAYGLSDEDSQTQFEQGKLLLTNLNKALKENVG